VAEHRSDSEGGGHVRTERVDARTDGFGECLRQFVSGRVLESRQEEGMTSTALEQELGPIDTDELCDGLEIERTEDEVVIDVELSAASGSRRSDDQGPLTAAA
jgi:hypothetical protein